SFVGSSYAESQAGPQPGASSPPGPESEADKASPAAKEMAAAARRRADFEARMERGRQTGLALGLLGTVRAVLRTMGQLPGRKTLVVFASGMARADDWRDPSRVTERLRAVIELANSAGVVVNCVDPAGLETDLPDAGAVTRPDPDGRLNRAMERAERRGTLADLAEGTGGSFLKDSNDVSGAVGRLAAELDDYYLLSYYPADDRLDDRYHQIRVRVVRDGLVVRARRGFRGRGVAGVNDLQ
ncbi:MAG TPA: VWA domain-containing protein, partial [Thermoanaerobaculia bacterium]|nr:VWA domain-containing protein [Thermoanaerobaculia bacterium]